MAGIPGVVGRIIARQRQSAPSIDDLRATLAALGVNVHPRWTEKRLAAEIAKLSPQPNEAASETSDAGA